MKLPLASMLTLAGVVRAHWCFYGNGGAAWVFAPPETGNGNIDITFIQASTQAVEHTNQITPKQGYNACESSLFTQICTLLCI